MARAAEGAALAGGPTVTDWRPPTLRPTTERARRLIAERRQRAPMAGSVALRIGQREMAALRHENALPLTGRLTRMFGVAVEEVDDAELLELVG